MWRVHGDMCDINFVIVYTPLCCIHADLSTPTAQHFLALHAHLFFMCWHWIQQAKQLFHRWHCFDLIRRVHVQNTHMMFYGACMEHVLQADSASEYNWVSTLFAIFVIILPLLFQVWMKILVLELLVAPSSCSREMSSASLKSILLHFIHVIAGIVYWASSTAKILVTYNKIRAWMHPV